MENSFKNRDFEQFVKQNADQYRMFPSDKVWRNISHAIHTRRHWYGIGLTLLLLTTGLVTWVMLINPTSEERMVASQSVAMVTKELTAPVEIATPAAPVIRAKPAAQDLAYIASPGTLNKNLFLADPAEAGVSAVEPLAESGPALEGPDQVASLVAARLNREPLVTSAIVSQPVIINSSASPANNNKLTQQTNGTPGIVKQSKPPAAPTDRHTATTDLPVVIREIEAAVSTETKTEEKKTVSADLLPPYTIESVFNSYKLQLNKRKRVSWQLYFLPTVSYRKLSENKQMLLNSQPVFAPSTAVVRDDINDIVKHKPDIGLELGLNMGYPIAKNLKLTGGFQLNVSKYDIKAYPFGVEEARIVLSSANGARRAVVAETNFRTLEAFTKPRWLSNYYVSISAPVGAELKLLGKKGMSMGIGGTLQPTYVIEDRAYVISTDFKNYATLPSLTRKFNLSTSFEVFASYTTGKIGWKIGPQVRYQLLSSFDKKYPVKEHLIDYGLKVGILLR